MKHSLLFLVFLCSGLVASAQPPTYTDGFSIGGPKDDAFTDAYYHNGTLYYIGTFSDSMDADPGSGTYWLHSKGLKDIFILAVTESGQFVKATSIGGPGEDYPAAITVDTAGYIYISGRINDKGIDLDPGTGEYKVQSSGTFIYDAYVARYNPSLGFNAAMVFPTRTTSTGNGSQVMDLAIGSGGDLFIGGSVTGTTDFDPGTSERLLGSPGSGTSHMVLGRYTRDLNLVWVYSTGYYGYTSASTLAIDPQTNDLIVSGLLGDKVDMHFGSDTFYLLRKGYGMDLYLARYSDQATLKWAFAVGDVNDDVPTEVAVNAAGRIGLCGAYSRTVDFNPDPRDSFKLSAVSDRDAFVAMYRPDGTFITAADTGTISIDQASGIAVDSKGFAYYTGQLSGSMFTAKIDSAGHTVWMMKQQGGVNYINGRKVFLDANENLVLTSMCTSSFTPVNGGSFNAIKTAGMSDIFVLRYKQAGSTTDNPEYAMPLQLPMLAPVPVRDEVQLIFRDNKLHSGAWQVIGMDGRRLSGGLSHTSGGTLRLDLRQLPAGMYLFEWSEGSNLVRMRFVKE